MGRRQERLGKLIQEELGDIFLKEGKAAFGNEFITVSNVHMTPDLSYAKVVLSVLNEKKPEQLIDKVREQQKSIRMALGKRIKDNVKQIPELHFYYDDTMDYVERMEDIFKNIDTGYEKGDETDGIDDSTNG